MKGVRVRDSLTREVFPVHAKAVVNATGPFSDSLRHISNPDASAMIMPSSGVHVALPDYYSPESTGMIVPKTKDGRVVFMLPWLEATIAGTTGESLEDLKCSLLKDFRTLVPCNMIVVMTMGLAHQQVLRVSNTLLCVVRCGSVLDEVISLGQA